MKKISCKRENISKDYTSEDYVKATGVVQRHVSYTLCTSDLCYAAAEKLIADLQWDKSEIGALVFVSQTADYILPATSCILQDRLGLSKECYATDCALGCSGWVYGLSQVLSLIATGEIKKALLLAGDAKKRADGRWCSSAKVTQKSVTALQIYPTIMPMTSSMDILRTFCENSKTRMVIIKDPRNAARIRTTEPAPARYWAKKIMVTPTTSFAPLEMPSTKGPAIGLRKNV